ncbi:MAG: hypothetical protein WDZ62_00300 [Candidatus Pacearchaeota archaeon]
MQLGKKTYWITVLGFILFFSGLIYLTGNITGKFSLNEDIEMSAIQECIETCNDMVSQLPKLNPESDSYSRQIDKINLKKYECIELNKLEENPLNENDLLDECDYVVSESKTQPGQCIESGKTISLEKGENCTDGIKKCCSGIGLCQEDNYGIPQVSCVN